MVNQLLWIEVVLKVSAGCLLLTAPALTTAVLGLPRPGTGFWPRLLGATLIGIGAASAVHGFLLPGHGLAPAGSLVINLAAGAFLLGVAIVGPHPPTRRGRLVLWALLGILALLILFEIAVA